MVHFPIILNIKMHRKVLKSLNLAYAMLLVQGRISQKILLSVCPLAVLGLQGIVVKCTAAIFFYLTILDYELEISIV